MRRVLLTLVAAGNLTVVSAVGPPASPDPMKIVDPEAPSSVVKVSNPPQAQTKTPTQAKDDSSLKRYATLLATFTAMAAIAVRRTRARKP